MKRIPPIALATAAILFSACSPKQEVAAPDAPPSTEIKFLDQKAASSIFKKTVESHLESLKLSDKVSVALVKTNADREQIIYIFRGMGGSSTAHPTLMWLGNRLPASDNQDCWMPWDQLPEPSAREPGIFMGTFVAETFELTVWIDQVGTDLFICYTELDAPKKTQ